MKCTAKKSFADFKGQAMSPRKQQSIKGGNDQANASQTESEFIIITDVIDG